MKTKQVLFLGFILLLTVVLAACGGAEEATATSTSLSADVPPTTPSEPAGESVSEAAPAGVRTFVVVPEESQASYVVDEEFFAGALDKLGIEAGNNVVVGTTPGVSGEIQLNLEASDPLESAHFSVDMTGLKTDQDRRDGWLQENAIETDSYPQATFAATSVEGLPANINEGEAINFQLVGDLTVRDVTNSVTFDVTAVLEGDTLQGTAVLPLMLTDFGIAPPDFANTLTVADAFRIEVELVARES